MNDAHLEVQVVRNDNETVYCRAYQSQTTGLFLPHVFVYTPSGSLRYHKLIDAAYQSKIEAIAAACNQVYAGGLQ